MSITLNILSILLLFAVFYQDLKSNQIYLIILIALCALGFINTNESIKSIAICVSIIIGLTGISALAVSAIKKKQAIALGDFLIIGYICIRFNIISVLIILIISSILGIVYSLFLSNKNNIPLAGFIAFTSIILIGLEYLNIIFNIETVYGLLTN